MIAYVLILCLLMHSNAPTLLYLLWGSGVVIYMLKEWS
jgi:hypothetical protein